MPLLNGNKDAVVFHALARKPKHGVVLVAAHVTFTTRPHADFQQLGEKRQDFTFVKLNDS